jgi:hypothetical protein
MGVILHPNKEVRERTLVRIQIHYEAAEGKRDILKTWELFGTDGEHEYLAQLRTRIRKEVVLLSHIKP